MAKLITDPQIKKVIRDYEYGECVELILEVAQACPQAREFLTMKLTGNHSEILENYKSKIRHEFYPSRGGFGRMSLKDAKKAISDFKKICPDKTMGIEIMLFYVESCIEFTNDYGDINETFYNSAASVYYNIVKELNTMNVEIYEKFADRLRACVDNTSGIGWGFHDALCDSWHELYWIDHENE